MAEPPVFDWSGDNLGRRERSSGTYGVRCRGPERSETARRVLDVYDQDRQRKTYAQQVEPRPYPAISAQRSSERISG